MPRSIHCPAASGTGLTNRAIFTVAHLTLVRHAARPAAIGGLWFRFWPDDALPLLMALTVGVMPTDPKVRGRRCSTC